MRLSSILLFCLTATNLLHSSLAGEIQIAREAVYKTKQWQTYNNLKNKFNLTPLGQTLLQAMKSKQSVLNQLKKNQQWKNYQKAKQAYNKAKKTYQSTPQWQDYVKAQAAIKTEFSKLPKATRDALAKPKGTKRNNLLNKIRASTIGKKLSY